MKLMQLIFADQNQSDQCSIFVNTYGNKTSQSNRIRSFCRS